MTRHFLNLSGLGRERLLATLDTADRLSMGQESESATRLRAFEGFQADRALLQHASGDAVALHCTPAHRGEEIEDEVLEGPRSVVWDQAEARLHTAKAVLLWALGFDG